MEVRKAAQSDADVAEWRDAWTDGLEADPMVE